MEHSSVTVTVNLNYIASAKEKELLSLKLSTGDEQRSSNAR